MSSKKRSIEKVSDVPSVATAKKNKTASPTTTTAKKPAEVLPTPPTRASTSTATTSRLTEKQQQRIAALKTTAPLPDFAIHFLTAPNISGVTTSTKPANLELFMKVLTATRSPPIGWPRIAHFEASKQLVFDVAGLRDLYYSTSDTVSGRSLYALMYAQFYPLNAIAQKLRPNVLRENYDDEDMPSKFMPSPRSENFQTNYIFRHVAEIAQDYIQRLEILDDANQLQSNDDAPLETCLLIEPFDFMRDNHNKLYHLPLVEGVTPHRSFVPAFVHTLTTRFERLRAALLISVVRYVYGFAFGRVFDTDFNLTAKDFAAWKASVRAEKFPVYNTFGSSTSVFLVNWLVECMCNTISTTNITQHELFTSPKAEVWRNVVPMQGSMSMTQRLLFYSLVDPLARINNADFVVSIDMKSVPNSSTRSLYTKSFDAMTETEKSDCDVSLRVFSMVLGLLHDTQRPDYGFSLSFAYDGVAATGVGVSREIVHRTFEALKKWQAFHYREEEDLLECAFDDVSFSNNRILQKCTEFLFVLTYWSVMNDEPIPYMLSPTLLHLMFGLRSNYVFSAAFDHMRVSRPQLANNILSVKNDDAVNLRDLGADDNGSALDVLSFYVSNNPFAKYNTVVHHCLKSIDAHPVFRHFYILIRELYDSAESLIFLLTHRLYGSEMAKKDAITNELAVALINPTNINLQLELEHEHLRLAVFSNSSVGTPIVDHVVYHENIIREHTQLPSFFFVESAKRMTYVLLIRWLLEAERKQLAKLWQLLKGTPTLIHAQIADVKVPNLERITTKVREATEPSSADQQCSSDNKLQSVIDKLSEATTELTGVHRLKNKNTISVTFRAASTETKFHMAPHFASCSGTLSLSICHLSYQSFAESMNQALSDDVTQFTLNT